MKRINLDIPEIELLDLGCGKTNKGLGIDIQDYGQQIVWDLRDGIPLPDNSVKNVCSSHFLEHITVADIDNLFREIIRVCKDGAVFNASMPHADRDEAMMLPHYTLWNEQRVRGIVLGYAMAGENTLQLLDVHREGMQLFFTMRINK